MDIIATINHYKMETRTTHQLLLMLHDFMKGQQDPMISHRCNVPVGMVFLIGRMWGKGKKNLSHGISHRESMILYNFVKEADELYPAGEKAGRMKWVEQQILNSEI